MPYFHKVLLQSTHGEYRVPRPVPVCSNAPISHSAVSFR